MPESPRWLFANDRNMEAQNAAVRLWGPAGPALLSEGGVLASCIPDILHNDRVESSAHASGGSRGVVGRFVYQLRIAPRTAPAGRASARGSAGAPKPGLFRLLTTKSVVISCLIFAFQQFAGINAIIYFSSSVFAQVPTQSLQRHSLVTEERGCTSKHPATPARSCASVREELGCAAAAHLH